MIQYSWGPYKKRRLGHRHSERRPSEDPGRGLTSRKYGSEGTNPADTLILNFQPPETRESQLLLFKPPVCVTATLANEMTMDFSKILFLITIRFFFIFSFLLQPKLALLPGFCSQRQGNSSSEDWLSDLNGHSLVECHHIFFFFSLICRGKHIHCFFFFPPKVIVYFVFNL